MSANIKIVKNDLSEPEAETNTSAERAEKFESLQQNCGAIVSSGGTVNTINIYNTNGNLPKK